MIKTLFSTTIYPKYLLILKHLCYILKIVLQVFIFAEKIRTADAQKTLLLL